MVKVVYIDEVKDWFSFYKYLSKNFEFEDNTELGDIYKGRDGCIYYEKDILNKWATIYNIKIKNIESLLLNDCSPKLKNCLKDNKIKSLRELSDMILEEKDLFKIKGCYEKTHKEIKKLLLKYRG